MSYTPDRIMGHSDESDGIEEYDNKLPSWWLGLFYFCIVWAGFYLVHYHFVANRSQAGAYEAEMAAAAERWPDQGEQVVEVTDESIAAGETIFATNCVGCHGVDLHGSAIAPNLVDEEWIHGGDLAEIVHTVTEGVPDKGMPTWGPILGPAQVAQVAAYVYSQGHHE